MKKIILMFILTVFLSGCLGVTMVTPLEFQTAVKMCAPNGGLEYIDTTFRQDVIDITCVNRARFNNVSMK